MKGRGKKKGSQAGGFEVFNVLDGDTSFLRSRFRLLSLAMHIRFRTIRQSYGMPAQLSCASE